MQNAHTIVNVPEHIIRVPTVMRRQAQSRVRIGCAYQPAIKVMPALEIYKARRPGATALKWVIGVVCFSGLYGFGLYL